MIMLSTCLAAGELDTAGRGSEVESGLFGERGWITVNWQKQTIYLITVLQKFSQKAKIKNLSTAGLTSERSRTLIIIEQFCVNNHRAESKTHCLNVFIAGETSVQFRTDEFEHTVQVVGWLLVGVLNLPQHLLVVVDHVSARYNNSIFGDLGHDSKLRHHVVRQGEGLVVRVERGVNGDCARVEFLLNHSHGLSLLPLLVVVFVARNGDVDVGENANSQSEVFVFSSNVSSPIDLNCWLLGLQHLKSITFPISFLYKITVNIKISYIILIKLQHCRTDIKSFRINHVVLSSSANNDTSINQTIYLNVALHSRYFDGSASFTGDSGRDVNISPAWRREFPRVEVANLAEKHLKICLIVALDSHLGKVAVGQQLHTRLKKLHGGNLQALFALVQAGKNLGSLVLVQKHRQTSQVASAK